MTFKLAPRKFGNALVPAVGYGAMGISLFYGPTESDEERLKVCLKLIYDCIWVVHTRSHCTTHLGAGCSV
jgi:hypothetical protein